jgi:hypothetical protein
MVSGSSPWLGRDETPNQPELSIHWSMEVVDIPPLDLASIISRKIMLKIVSQSRLSKGTLEWLQKQFDGENTRGDLEH